MDKLAESVAASFTGALTKLKLASGSPQRGSSSLGCFSFPSTKSSGSTIKLQRKAPQTWHRAEEPQVVYKLVLPDSDRAAKLSPKEKQDRRKKRMAASKARKRNKGR